MAASKRIQIKILGALDDKADGNLYLDGAKIGEVIIRREPESDFSLFELLGELLEVT